MKTLKGMTFQTWSNIIVSIDISLPLIDISLLSIILLASAFCRNIKARMLMNQKPNFLFRLVTVILENVNALTGLEGLRANASHGADLPGYCLRDGVL